MKRLLILLIFTPRLFGQASGNATILVFPSTPFGTCSARQLALNNATGELYTCVGAGASSSGTWQIIQSGGGTGTVVSFGAGGLPPLFTTNVTTPTSTPNLSFFLNNIAPNTLFGNFTSSNGQPSWFTPSGDVSMANGQFTLNRMTFSGTSIPLGSVPSTGQFLTFNGTSIVGGTPTGGGGGSGLLGCATAVSGVLTCDVSMAVTAAGGGQLSLTSATVPTSGPPGPVAMLVADSTGHPFWSNGNGTSFYALGAGGGGGAATSLQFGSTVFNLGAPPSQGQCLSYDGSNITGVACGGGGGGAVPIGGVTTIQ